jgi:hypothetical protein
MNQASSSKMIEPQELPSSHQLQKKTEHGPSFLVSLLQ